MKGLLYSWFISGKNYWITTLVVFAVLLTAIFAAIPHLGFLDELLPFFAVISGIVLMIIPCESLCNELEASIKTRFADYALAAISKKTYVNMLLVRNLICMGISVVLGYILFFSYISVTNTELSSELILLVPCFALLTYATDFICIPLVIKMKNAEKAGLIVGFFYGVLVLFFMLHENVVNYGNDVEITVFIKFVLMKEGILIGAAVLCYAIAYAAALKIVKRGDVC